MKEIRKVVAAVENLPDSQIFRVEIGDPIQQLLAERAHLAQTLGTDPENISVCADLQIIMEEKIAGLSKKELGRARKLAQALQTERLWKDPECTIPITLAEASSQYQAFVNAVLERSEEEYGRS